MAGVVIAFMRELDRRGAPARSALAADAGALPARLGAQLLASVIVFGLALTIVGLPIAIWKYVSWQFVQQEILFEDKPFREAFRGSSRIVRGRWCEPSASPASCG